MLSVILYNAHRAWLVGMGKRKHQDEDSDNEEGTVVKKEKAEHIVVDEETPRLVYWLILDKVVNSSQQYENTTTLT